MRLERLNYNKIKIFLTFDDLVERGLTKEDLWQDSLKVHQLFRDMIEEANEELGFVANGPIAVEVYSLQAQGMVVIVSKSIEDSFIDDEAEEDYSDDYIEMQVTVDQSDDIFYEFRSFEDIIGLSARLVALNVNGGKLYSYENNFYLLFEEELYLSSDNIIAILSEFGNPATRTKYRVHEYGKLLISKNAMNDVYHYFLSKSDQKL